VSYQPQPDETVIPASPWASRQRGARWRDPRLWLGILLVLGSVVVGAKVLASADDTVAVWQVAHDIPAGTKVEAADLRVTRVHFAESSTAAHYLLAAGSVEAGAHATRDLHAGEMLTADDISTARSAPTRELPLGVSAAHQPVDLRAGDHVDVWAVPSPDTAVAGSQRAPALVLRNVTVLSVGSSLSGVSGERQVLVAIGDDVDVSSVLSGAAGAQIVLVRLAG
jgi:Flp pilus assembly protein CpaB